MKQSFNRFRELIVATLGMPRELLLILGLMVIAGWGFTTLAVRTASDVIQQRAQSEFNRLSGQVTSEAERRIESPFFIARGLRGLYMANESVERGEFRAFVASRDLSKEFPGSTGLGFIQRVLRSDLERFIASERADMAPDFTVNTGGESPVLYVSKFIEPLETNRAVWGRDFGMDPALRAAIERAVRSGEPTVTPRVALAQDSAQRRTVLYLLAVYKKGTQLTTPEEREAGLVGLAYAPVVIEDLFASITAKTGNLLHIEVFDGQDLSTAIPLLDMDGEAQTAQTGQAPFDQSSASGPMFHNITTTVVGGREWSVVASSTPEFEAMIDRSLPVMIGVVGIVLTTLLAGLVCSLGTARTQAMALAQNMTADLESAKNQAEAALREAEALRRTVDEQSIVSVADPTGRIVEVNAQFCRISGYTREELVGQDHRIVN